MAALDAAVGQSGGRLRAGRTMRARSRSRSRRGHRDRSLRRVQHHRRRQGLGETRPRRRRRPGRRSVESISARARSRAAIPGARRAGDPSAAFMSAAASPCCRRCPPISSKRSISAFICSRARPKAAEAHQRQMSAIGERSGHHVMSAFGPEAVVYWRQSENLTTSAHFRFLRYEFVDAEGGPRDGRRAQILRVTIFGFAASENSGRA